MVDFTNQNALPGKTVTEIKKAKYVGLRVGSSLPAGVKSDDQFRFMIGSKSNEDIPLEFGIRKVVEGKISMLWFERIIQQNNQVETEWEVMDVLVLPKISGNQRICGSYCFSGKEFEPEIIAIADYENREYLTRVRRAWRASRVNKRFEEIPTKGIKCENVGWGI